MPYDNFIPPQNQEESGVQLQVKLPETEFKDVLSLSFINQKSSDVNSIILTSRYEECPARFSSYQNPAKFRGYNFKLVGKCIMPRAVSPCLMTKWTLEMWKCITKSD